jgi:hypothetical protein
LDGGHREDGNMFWTVIFAFREISSDSGNSDTVMTFIIFLRDLSHTLFCSPYPLNSVDLRGTTVQYILLYLGSVTCK